MEAAHVWAARAEQLLHTQIVNLAKLEKHHITGMLETIRSYIAGLQNDYESGERHARLALQNLPAKDRNGRALALTMLGNVLRYLGKLEEAEEAYDTACSLVEKSANNHVALMAHINRTGFMVFRGKLNQAVEEYKALFQYVDPLTPSASMIGLAYLSLGRVYLEQNKLLEARQYTQKGMDISEAWGHGEYVISGYIDMAEVCLAEGDLKGALEKMARARHLSGEISWPSRLQALEIKMQLADGNMAVVVEWARAFEAQKDSVPMDLSNTAIYLSLARVWMAEKRWVEALQLLSQMSEMINHSGMVRYRLGSLVLLALSCKRAGRHSVALKTLEKALVLAELETFVRVFFDEGAAIVELLKSIPLHSRGRKYARYLLNEFGRTESGKYADASPDLIEALSERELEILHLLNTSMDSMEIAEHLCISVSTVRTHIRNIYAKLGASRRMEAVQRAREMGLL